MTSRLDPPRRRLYVLRFVERDNQHPADSGPWQFCLKDIQTGELHTFADVDALIHFLQAAVTDEEDDTDAME